MLGVLRATRQTEPGKIGKLFFVPRLGRKIERRKMTNFVDQINATTLSKMFSLAKIAFNDDDDA